MRKAFTTIELLIACTIIGIIAAIAVPRVRSTLDSFAVEAAGRDVINVFALARFAALRDGGADVQVDSMSVTLRSGGTVVFQRDIAHTHSVRMRTNVARVRYSATGLGLGISNGSITISRGAAADTVVVSRLGRARR